MQRTDDLWKLAEFAGHVETVRFHVRWGAIFQIPFFRISLQLLLKVNHWWQLLLQPASGCGACGLKKLGEWEGSQLSPSATLTKNKNNASNVNAIDQTSRFPLIHQRFYLSDCAYESLCAGVSKIKFAPNINIRHLCLYYDDLSTKKQIANCPS